MKKFTDEQKQVLVKAYENLAGHTADWEEVKEAVADYIDKNGLPETDSHDMLSGDGLDEYLENNGLSFDDYAVIIEL